MSTTTTEAKEENLLKLPFSEIAFQTTKNGSLVSKLLLKNPHESMFVAFKLKTNAPARYSVKPVVGLVDPRSGVMEVLVKTEQSIAPGDRFLIQTVMLSPQEASEFTAATWKNIEKSRVVETFVDCKTPAFLRRYTESMQSITQDHSGSPLKSSVSTASEYSPMETPQLRTPMKSPRKTVKIVKTGYSFTHLLLAAFFALVIGLAIPLEQWIEQHWS